MEAVLRGGGAGPVDLPQRAPTSPPRWRSSSPPPTGHYLVMDWASVWVDIAVGLLIADALGAWVPEAFWQRFFLVDHRQDHLARVTSRTSG